MKRIFGPVPSRRLGQSLGIDPVPLKTCNWNCVYCQLGRTMPFRTERRHNFKVSNILLEVEEALGAHQPGEIDWITFVGSGETTLHDGLGEMIRGVKALTEIPVAVITNGSLLYMPEMREELQDADAVLPSLDAGNPVLYRRINRPHGSLTFDRLTSGLIAFRKAYDQNLWLEVMLVRGLNDTHEALNEIAHWIDKINPDQVHVVQPTRPAAEIWVKPPDDEGLMRAKNILGNVAKIIMPAIGSFDMSNDTDLVEAIIGIITRHPMRESELIDTLTDWSLNDVNKTLSKLQESGRAQIVIRDGIRFWGAAEAYYAFRNNKPLK
jgi:wyosine [tRNA(Phe)-imidazoG37] synthetase (radical SAM superfamily)